MTEQLLQDRPVDAPAPRPPAAKPRAASIRDLAERYPWILGAVGLLLVSTVVVLWARTRPGYDPYGWLVWGYQTLHLSLDLGGAPSWKPLPYLFTVPFALAGHYQIWLWMFFSAAVATTCTTS